MRGFKHTASFASFLGLRVQLMRQQIYIPLQITTGFCSQYK